MSEIKDGDLVHVLYGSTVLWTVETVRRGSAWLFRESNSGRMVNLIRPLDYLTKVEPKFEAGKTYRRIPQVFATLLNVTVESANECGAIGWTAGNQPWARTHQQRHQYEEVPAEKVEACTVGLTENPRELTKAVITTYNPGSYLLRNITDKSEWLLTPEGKWERYYRPALPEF